MTEHLNDPAAGPWLEDARRFLSLIETAGQQFTAGEGHPVECTWCPLCQALNLARRSGPDLLERVAEVATGLATTLRQSQERNPAPPSPATDPEEAEVPAPPATVRIDITD